MLKRIVIEGINHCTCSRCGDCKASEIEVVFEKSEVLLNKLPYHIGRLQTSDHIICDPAISRKHSVINKDAKGCWFIEDLSNNGIQVNELVIGKGKTHPLYDKDRITLSANHVFEFLIIKKPLEETTLNTNNNENPTYKGYVPESSLTKLEAEHKQQISSLEADHKQQISSLEADHKQQISRLEEEHKQRITSLELKQNNDVDVFKNHHISEEDFHKLEEDLRKSYKQFDDLGDELKNLQAASFITETSLNIKEMECDDQKVEIEKLKQERNEMKKELDGIKREQVDRAKEAREKQVEAKNEAVLNQMLKIESIMDSELTCAICLEIVIESCTINCGHTFCTKCVQDCQKKQKPCLCPTCRANITSTSRSAMLDSFVAKLTENMTEEFRIKWGQAMHERKRTGTATGPPAAKRRKGNPAPQFLPVFPFVVPPIPIPEPEVFIDLTTSN